MYGETGGLKSKHRSGRPTLLNEMSRRSIVRKIKENPKISAPKIANEIQRELSISVCDETIRNVLRKNGYHGRVPRRKPLISERNRIKRIQFARDHKNKDNSFWDQVMFTDESKYNIFGCDGKGKIWRKSNEEMKIKNLCATVKHGGGSVMVWGCMAASGVGNLVFIDSIMDKWLYLDILKSNLKQSAAKLCLGKSFIFQQDNDPKHTAHIIREYLIYNVAKQLHSPPQSPDLNPIEHLWDELERRIRKYPISNKNMLKNRLNEEWGNIGADITKKLVDSMPRRLQAVIELKGYPTKC